MNVTFAKLAMAILAGGMFAANAVSETKTANGFDRLKTLVGDWDVTAPDAKPFVSSFDWFRMTRRWKKHFKMRRTIRW